MNVRLIENETDHAAALARIEDIFDACPGTPKGDELELLVHRVEEYETAHHAIEPPDPIEAIKFRMEQGGLKQIDLVPLLFPGGQDCRTMAMAARRRVRRGSAHDDHALWAWQARVRQLVEVQELGAYDAEAMSLDLIRAVVCLSGLDDGPVQARRLLTKTGIGMVVLHYLPGTHLDGAAMVRHDGHPVVAVTLRHDRLDNFWFTLAHELAHVVLHLAKGDTSIFMDDLEATPSTDTREKEADSLAADSLIPTEEWRRSKVVQAPTDTNIRELAVRTRVHPAIVAGRIRFERHNYRSLNHLVGRRMVRRLFPSYRAGEAP